MGSFSIGSKLHGRKTLEFTDVEVSEQFLCNVRSELPHNSLNPNFINNVSGWLFIEQNNSETRVQDEFLNVSPSLWLAYSFSETPTMCGMLFSS